MSISIKTLDTMGRLARSLFRHCLIASVLAVYVMQTAFAEMAFVERVGGRKIAAYFPCAPENKDLISEIGKTVALQCSRPIPNGACSYTLLEQPLDIESYEARGFDSVIQVHRKFLAMTQSYGPLKESVVKTQAFGSVLRYEAYRTQSDVEIFSRGQWLVVYPSLVRLAVSCFPRNVTASERAAQEAFFSSLVVLK